MFKKKRIERERIYWRNAVEANATSMCVSRSEFYIHDLAMSAMTGCLVKGDDRTPGELAKYCYDIAEAMIKEGKIRDNNFMNGHSRISVTTKTQKK